MTFDFDTCPPRLGTDSQKWQKYAGRDVLPLWVADMDFKSSPAIIAALQERVAHGVFGYARPVKSTVGAVVDACAHHYGWRIDGSWIVWLPGLVCGLNVTAQAFAQTGDEVLTLTPVYPPFMTAPKNSARISAQASFVLRDSRWEIDWAALEQAVTPRTKLFYLCNPHNPVGRVFPEATVARLVEFCRRHQLILISDEIHCDLVLDDLPHTSGLKFAGPDGPPMVAMFAPSKTFNLAGLACAFLVIPDATTRRTFQRAARGLITEINAFGYTGCEAALRHGWPWRDELLGVLRANRDHLESFIASSLPGIFTWHVEATYLAWLDARALGLPNACKFFEEHGVGLSDGVPFGAAPGFLRLNFGCPRAQLDEALSRMVRALSSR